MKFSGPYYDNARSSVRDVNSFGFLSVRYDGSVIQLQYRLLIVMMSIILCARRYYVTLNASFLPLCALVSYVHAC